LTVFRRLEAALRTVLNDTLEELDPTLDSVARNERIDQMFVTMSAGDLLAMLPELFS